MKAKERPTARMRGKLTCAVRTDSSCKSPNAAKLPQPHGQPMRCPRTMLRGEDLGLMGWEKAKNMVGPRAGQMRGAPLRWARKLR